MKYIFITLQLMIPIMLFAQQGHLPGTKSVSVNVLDHSATYKDTLFLMYFTNTLNNVPTQTGDYRTLIATMQKDSFFHFIFPVNKKSGNFFLGRKTRGNDSIYHVSSSLRFIQLTNLFPPVAGDKILIRITEFQKPFQGSLGYKLAFSGKGSFKYTIQERLRDFNTQIEPTEVFDDNYDYVNHNSDSEIITQKLRYLNSIKEKLGKEEYDILKTNIIYRNPVNTPGMVEYYLKTKLKDQEPEIQRYDLIKFKDYYNKFFLSNSHYGIPTEALLKTGFYVPYLLRKIAKCDFLVNDISNDQFYNYLKRHFNGELRDQLLTCYFFSSGLNGFVNPENITDAIKTVKTSYCLQKLRSFTTNFNSRSIYKFPFIDINGKTIHTTDFKGKVILIDFWFTGCGACKDYFKNDLSQVEKFYKANANVVFLSVCIDKSQMTWKKSVSGEEYTSNEAVNIYTMGQANQHPIVKFYNVLSYPSIILIGKSGKILTINNESLRKKSTLINCINEALTNK